MPIDSLEIKEFMPPRVKRALLPGPSTRTIGRLRTVTDDDPVSLVRDRGTYWETIAGAVGLPFFNVKSFGAVGDGVTDDTTAINAAIAAANAVSNAGIVGATVYFPPGKYKVTATLTAPTSNVILQGTGYGYPSSASTIYYTPTTGKVIDLGSGLANVTFNDLYFLGSGGTTETNDCLFATSATMIHIERCSFNNFGGSAIRISAGLGLQLFNVEAQNCLLAAVPSSYSGLTARRGVVEIGCTEAMMEWCNINGVAGTADANSGRIGNGFMIAVYVKTTGGVTRFFNSVAAFAQYGFVFESSQHHQVSQCRAEYNQGHGFVVEAQQSIFTACRAQDNSHDTDNTYSGFSVTGWSNTFIGNKIHTVSFTNKHKYGFDVNVGAGVGYTLLNSFTNNSMSDTARSIYKFAVSGNTPFAVNGLNFIQLLTGTGTQTFDGQKGDHWKLVVNANIATEITGTNLIEGHTYELEVLNSSGAAPAITLNATLFKATTLTLSPADTKRKAMQFTYDGTNLILSGGGVSSDFS